MKPNPCPLKRQTAKEFLELQRLMAGSIMRPLTDAGAMQPRGANSKSMNKVAAGFIKPNERLTSFERLEIYNRQYWSRLRNCLVDDYPGLNAILGKRRFEMLAVAYLARHPSRSFTLRNLGRDLVRFLQAELRWTAPHEALALDMARLEWAHIEAFDNEAAAPLTLANLSGVNAARMRLRLQPHLTLLRLSHEVDNLRVQLKQDAGLRSEASNAVEQRGRGSGSRLRIKALPAPIHLGVHRHQNGVYYKRLEPGQYRILRALQAGATIGNACGRVLKSGGVSHNLAADVARWFEDCAALGWFCKR